MKFEILQKNKKAGSFGFLCMISAGAVLIYALSMPLNIQAQLIRSDSTLTMKNLKTKFGLSSQQLNQLRPLIERRAGKLYKILNKYRDKSDLCFVPFWADTNIWFELQNIRQQPNPNLTKSQQRALRAANSVLEKEILLSLIDEQLLAMSEELELDSYQAEDIYNILVQNMGMNRLVINKPQLSIDSLKTRLEFISNETEIKIGNILLPDQREKYRKQKQKMQQGVNFWGVVPSTGDAPQTIDVNRSVTSQLDDSTTKKQAL